MMETLIYIGLVVCGVRALFCLLRGHPEVRQPEQEPRTQIDYYRESAERQRELRSTYWGVPPAVEHDLNYNPVSNYLHPLNPITDPFGVYGGHDSNSGPCPDAPGSSDSSCGSGD